MVAWAYRQGVSVTGLSEECSGFFGIGRKYTAIINIVLDVDDDIAHQWQIVRPQLTAWSSKRGAKREGVEFLFFTHAQRLDDIRAFLGGGAIYDPELLPLFQEFPPLVTLMTADGQACEAFRLEPPSLKK